MKRNVGLWIDHRKAVIVSIAGGLEEIKSIESEMEKHVRFSGGAQKNSEEDQRDRRFTVHLNKYYDKVIAFIKDAESILVVGPGEAKVEFLRRLDGEKRIGRVVALEAADKLTIPQIVEKVKEHFYD
jgi:stalled ribosome rescue protein Dom34